MLPPSAVLDAPLSYALIRSEPDAAPPAGPARRPVQSTPRRAPESGPRHGAVAAARDGREARCRVACVLVALQAGLRAEDILSNRRSQARVSEARHLAMYVAHVALHVPQGDVAVGFRRDRSTVAHACRKVEDRRDDPAFDSAVTLLEASARWILGW